MGDTVSRAEAKALLAKPAKAAKYRNQPVFVDGIRFASKAESRRYVALKDMEKRGAISRLRLQTRWVLSVDGALIATYVSDFSYEDATRGLVVEDVKGVLTPEFKLKAKLFEALYGFPITIVGKSDWGALREVVVPKEVKAA